MLQETQKFSHFIMHSLVEQEDKLNSWSCLILRNYHVLVKAVFTTCNVWAPPCQPFSKFSCFKLLIVWFDVLHPHEGSPHSGQDKCISHFIMRSLVEQEDKLNSWSCIILRNYHILAKAVFTACNVIVWVPH